MAITTYDHEMALFDEGIKREFPEHNGPEDIETALDAMRKLKRPECDGIALSPVSKAPAQVMILLQVGLRRTIELTEAAIREINLRNVVSTALLSRGTLETACLLWDVMNAIEEVVASGDRGEVKRLLETLSKSLLGGKAKEVMLDEAIEARNVITIIQRLSKKFDVPLFGFFERLSEYAHPNYHGMMATYTEAGAEGGIKAFCDGRTSSKRALLITAIGTVATSCSIIIESFKIAAARLESLAALAERAVFEAGTWPKEIEYPVRRS